MYDSDGEPTICVKASDEIIANQSYYDGFDPETVNTITFYVDNEPYTCTPGLTWRQYNPVIDGMYASEGPAGTVYLSGDNGPKGLITGDNISEQYYREWVYMDDVIESQYYHTTDAPALITAGRYSFKAYDQLTEAPGSYSYNTPLSFDIYTQDYEGNLVSSSSSIYIRAEGGYTSVNSSVPIYGQIYYRDVPNITFGGYYPAGDLVGEDNYSIVAQLRFSSNTIMPAPIANWLLLNTTYST